MAHDAERLKVLWKKGQNFFASFFAEISNVRKAINNEATFIQWCSEDLGLPLITLTRISDVLTLADAARVKAELARAKAVEQQQRRRDREYQHLIAAQERKRKEDEKAAAAAAAARQLEQKKVADKLARKQASKRKNNAGWKAKQREEKRAALAKFRGANIALSVVKFSAITEDELATRIKTAIGKIANANTDRIEWSIELAGLMVEARALYPAHQRFNQWLDKHNIQMDAHDRAALLNLGLDLQAMRTIMQQTNKTSFRHIWEDVKLQIEAK